ncbi:response regulator [Candidatus Wolfebacteria bacterium]|nr:response regulator [Candidatus Wolfebacteria bacterium]
MSSANKKYILLIEDDVLLSRALQIKAQKEGVTIKPLLDGKEALEFIKDNAEPKPSLVLLDLMLPHVSGFEILETLRKTRDWEKIPVIVLSNLGQAMDIEKIKAMKVDAYLVKTDVKLEELIKRISGYLK